jgi:hypothetical protein
MYRRRVLYRHPLAYAQGFAAAAAHARRDLARLREDFRLEAEMIREEIKMARGELRRLQQLDAAQRVEREWGQPLH